MSKTCKYDISWVGGCPEPVKKDGYCQKHYETSCVVCGEQATHTCSYTGQLVCGQPLCDGCEGWEDLTKPSGSWGFMNHGHRKKGEKQ